jgi:hypothetical protein
MAVVIAALMAGGAMIFASMQVPVGLETTRAVADDRERTPLSCDGKPADFHAERAKTIIRKAHGHDRVLDPSPAEPPEKFAWRAHKVCLLDGERRRRIGQFVDKRAAALTAFYYGLISPPGAATLAARRSCENGGSYGDDGNGDAYLGAYQFDGPTWAATARVFTRLTGIAANPSRLALPREQDIRAAIADAQSSGDPWPNCP